MVSILFLLAGALWLINPYCSSCTPSRGRGFRWAVKKGGVPSLSALAGSSTAMLIPPRHAPSHASATHPHRLWHVSASPSQNPLSALAPLCLTVLGLCHTVPRPHIGSGIPLPHRPKTLYRLWHPSAAPSQNPLSALAGLSHRSAVPLPHRHRPLLGPGPPPLQSSPSDP